MTDHQDSGRQQGCNLKPGFAFGGFVPDVLGGVLFKADERGDWADAANRCDELRMQWAFRESMKAVGSSSPNPAVGCWVFKDEQPLFGSHTQPYGGLHAERHALLSQGLSVFPEGCEVYVTLEPCSHFGKTPPCVELFEASKNIRVVVASKDPNPLVGGQGLERIRRSGLGLTVGTLSSEVRATLLPFLKWATNQAPLIGLKWAQSIDGKLADFQGSSKWLTGPELKNYTFWLRQKYDCIAVGLGTLRADRPSLDVRAFTEDVAIRHPLRIVLDPRGRFLTLDRLEQLNLLGSGNTAQSSDLPKSQALEQGFATEGMDAASVQGKSWIVVTARQAVQHASGIEFDTLGPHLIATVDQDQFLEQFRNFLRSKELQQRNAGRQIQSILVEGGAGVHALFLSQHAFDILHVYQAPLLLGGSVHTVSRESELSTFPQTLAHAQRLRLLQSFSAGCDTVSEFVTEEIAKLLAGESVSVY